MLHVPVTSLRKTMENLRSTIIGRLTGAFGFAGNAVVKSPVMVIGFCLSLSFLFAAGVTNLTTETDSIELWVPTSADSYNHRTVVKSNYKGADRGINILVTARDGGSMLRDSHLLEVLDLHKGVTSTIAAPDPPHGRFDDYCDRAAPEIRCPVGGLLEIFGFDEGTIRHAAEHGSLLTTIQSLSRFLPLSIYLGGTEYDATGKLTGATVVSLGFGMTQYNTSKAPREDDEENVMKFELEVMERLYDDWNADDSRLTTTAILTQRSVDDEIQRLIQVDSILFGVSICAIVLILSLTLGRFNCVESRFTLGFSAILIVMLGLGFSFGCMGWFGMPINPICFIIPFIVAGVGVDDLIVVESFFQAKVDSGLSVEERMPEALKEAGVALFLTSSSSVFAFTSGTFLDLPGVSQFCACGALAFLWVWFLSLTLFPAFLVIDQRRVDARRGCCLCCVRHSTKGVVSPGADVADGKDSVVRPTKLDAFLTPILASPVGGALMLVLFVGFAASMGAIMVENSVGLEIDDIVPDDSYILDVFDLREKFWSGKLQRPLSLYMMGDTVYTDPQETAKLEAYFDWVERSDFVEDGSRIGMTSGSWYRWYTLWLQAQGKDKHEDFTAHLGDFFSIPIWSHNGSTVVPSSFWGEVVCKEGNGKTCAGGVVSARFLIIVSSKGGTAVAYKLKEEFNGELARVGFPDSYWYDDFFCFADSDYAMPEYLTRNLMLALAAIFILMLLFMDVVAAFCISICVVFIDLDLLGLIYLWDVKISSVTFSCLLMSIGLSIDYNVHIAHAFLETKGSPKERIEGALRMMGNPVLKGALTTFVGACVLSQASSTVFRIFFKVTFGTVVFGCAHGVILLPVLLAFAQRIGFLRQHSL